jgi:hypothetical protein
MHAPPKFGRSTERGRDERPGASLPHSIMDRTSFLHCSIVKMTKIHIFHIVMQLHACGNEFLARPLALSGSGARIVEA